MLEASSIAQAIKQICAEKNLSEEAVLETIESALAAAYRKDFGEKDQNIKVEFDLKTGEFNVFDLKTVVEDLPQDYFDKLEERKEKIKEMRERGEEVDYDEFEEMEIKFNPKTDLQLKDAIEKQGEAAIGDIIKTQLEVPSSFGRMAAQTAKQVIIQKLREAERDVLMDEYKDKIGEIIVGTVQKTDGRNILIDLGRVTGVLPISEQIARERFKPGDRIKVYLASVVSGPKGPEIILSRSHENILRELFTMEIPEIANQAIEIKAIAREAGSRAKVAVYTAEENIDPIGSCVGQRGARIQTIIGELGGEKIDIIEWSEKPEVFITNSLAPAHIIKVEINEQDKSATAIVKADQLSLAIGKLGQNVRLAAKLTGWKINIKEQESGKEISQEEIKSLAKENKELIEEAKLEVPPAEINSVADETSEKTEDKKEKKAKAVKVKKEKKEKKTKKSKEE